MSDNSRPMRRVHFDRLGPNPESYDTLEEKEIQRFLDHARDLMKGRDPKIKVVVEADCFASLCAEVLCWRMANRVMG